MESSVNAKSTGISTLSIIGIVFVTLKLTGHIDWSWWWVTLPFWGGFAIAIAFIAAFAFLMLPVYIAKRLQK
jgi:hypothetical protein